MERRHITFALWVLASVAMFLAALDPVFLSGFAFEAYVPFLVLPLAAIGVGSLYAVGWWMVVLRIVAIPIALGDLVLLALTEGQPTAFGSVVIAIGIATLIAALIALFMQPMRRPSLGM